MNENRKPNEPRPNTQPLDIKRFSPHSVEIPGHIVPLGDGENITVNGVTIKLEMHNVEFYISQIAIGERNIRSRFKTGHIYQVNGFFMFSGSRPLNGGDKLDFRFGAAEPTQS